MAGDARETTAPSQLPIYVLIGTKAQYIKTAPLMRLLASTGRGYRLIDTGQHAALTAHMRAELNVKVPDAFLWGGKDITSIARAVPWLIKLTSLALLGGSKLSGELFTEGRGICVIHGDTVSTLLALLIAKRARMEVAHIEAGLRSFNIFKPLPEEIVRIICMRFSDYLFAPSDWAVENLERMGVKGKIVNVGQNTAVEALYHSLENSAAPRPVEPPYCVMTIHRLETLLFKNRLNFVVDTAERIGRSMSVVFVMHAATRKKFQSHGLLDRITGCRSIIQMDLMEHNRFVNLLAEASMVVSDGGSIQEECSYLGIPCLVLRKETERREGMGANAELCPFESEVVDRFIANHSRMKNSNRVENLHASERILQALSGNCILDTNRPNSYICVKPLGRSL